MIRIIGKSNAEETKIITAVVTLALILTLLLPTAVAQTPSSSSYQHKDNTLKPSIRIILMASSAIIFLIVTFFICIHHCSTSNLITTTTTNSTSPSSHTISIPSSHGCHRGLDPSIHSTFPSFTYSEVKSHKIGKGTLACAVCLDDFEDEEIIKLLPKCDHVFHLDCIDAWLRSHFTCPVCRSNLDPDLDHASVSVAGPSRTGSEAVSLFRWTSDETVRTGPSRTSSEAVSLFRWASGDTVRTETIAEVEENIERRRSVNRRTPSLSMIGSFFFSRFGRWNSTGHCVVQPGDDLNRFTLKLPREIRNQLLNRSASALVFPTASSMRNGYRNPGGRGRCNGSVGDRWWLLGIGSGLFNRNWYRSSPYGFNSTKYNSARPVV